MKYSDKIHSVGEDCANCDALRAENEQLQKKIEQLQQYAQHDELTKLYNRRYFRKIIEERIARCERYGDVSALLFLDVDNLKSINDGFGHIVGDKLLVRFAETMSLNIRNSDVVARVGGDEFAMLIDNLDAEQVEAKIISLHKGLADTHFLHDDQKIDIAASIGYCFIGPKDSVNGLLSRADASMYAAKRSKK